MVDASIELSGIAALVVFEVGERDEAKPSVLCRNKSITHRAAAALLLRVAPGTRALVDSGLSSEELIETATTCHDERTLVR